MIYELKACPNHRIPDVTNMGTTLNLDAAHVKDRLAKLTPRELEISVLHFVEGRSQTLIAQWMGIAVRVVQWHLEHAVAKVPQLRPLRARARAKPPQVRVLHLSQLPSGDCRGPFNIDEL